MIEISIFRFISIFRNKCYDPFNQSLQKCFMTELWFLEDLRYMDSSSLTCTLSGISTNNSFPHLRMLRFGMKNQVIVGTCIACNHLKTLLALEFLGFVVEPFWWFIEERFQGRCERKYSLNY